MYMCIHYSLSICQCLFWLFGEGKYVFPSKLVGFRDMLIIRRNFVVFETVLTQLHLNYDFCPYVSLNS